MSKITIEYRRQYVHFDGDKPCQWNGQEYPDQQSAHVGINDHLEKTNQEFPSILDTLKNEVRANGLHDPHGTCMGWKFALADYMTEFFSSPPEEWQFRQAMGGAEIDAWEYQTLELFQPTEEECNHLGAILHRWDNMNRARGIDY